MRRFEALDSLRGVSALLVVLYHLDQDVWTSWHGDAWLDHLDLAVEFFFVLSGFVIASAYGERLQRKGEIIPYMLRRIGRIMPLHWAMLFTLVAYAIVRVIAAAPPLDIRAVFDGGVYDISAILTNTLMLHGIGFENHLTWNYPSWSVSAEMWTYLVFALIWAVFAARSVWVALALAIVCPVLVAAFPSDSLSPMTLVRVVGGFAAGVVMRHAFTRVDPVLTPWIQRAKLATAFELAALAGVAFYMLSVGTLWLAPFVFCGVVLIFALEAGGVSRLLRTAPMLTLGAISYSIYMTHAVLLMMLWGVVSGIEANTDLVLTGEVDGGRLWGVTPLIGNGVAIGVIALVIAVSLATYRWIELPGQRWGQRAAERWKRGAV